MHSPSSPTSRPSRLAGTRLRAVVLAAVLLPTLAGTAVAGLLPEPRNVGSDGHKGVQFTMRDRFVDIELRQIDGKENALVSRLAWAGVSVACKGTNRRGRVVIGTIQTAWPANAPLYRMHLTRDASRRTQWCVLEYADGKDIAVARVFRKPVPATTPATSGTTATTPATTP